LKYLFDKIDEVSRIIKSADMILLLSDYDGTLTPIAQRPELAKLGSRTRRLLDEIADMPNVKIGILSGRSLEGLKRSIKIKGIYYAGNHGFEIEGPSGGFVHPKAKKSLSVLSSIAKKLYQRLGSIDGVIIEDKGLSLSVHYRMIKDRDFDKLKSGFRQSTDEYLKSGKINVMQGKKVFEIRPPVQWDKGKALLWILEKFKNQVSKGSVLPIYLGDDITDEDAFAAMPKKGISIFVGESKSSRAMYQLKSVWEVEVFLNFLKEILHGSTSGA